MSGYAIWSGTCPHCGLENTAFNSVAQYHQRGIEDSSSSFWIVFFVCNACKGGLVADVLSSQGYGPHIADYCLAVPGSYLIDHRKVEFTVIETYPKPPIHAAPEHVPDRVAATYIEASENLHRQKYETSQMLSRKTLDLATKRLLPDSKKSLYQRIEELKDARKITDEMSDWAHIVRSDGNDSTHDEDEVTKEAATELLAFTETFLMYAFTLPGMIHARRSNES